MTTHAPVEAHSGAEARPMSVEIVHRPGGTAEALRALHDAQAAEIRALRSRLKECEEALVLYVLGDADAGGLDEALAYIDRQLPEDVCYAILGEAGML